jgi:hypothetical protein
MAVDGGASASDLAAGIRDLAIGCSLGDQPPIVRAGRYPSTQEIVGALFDGRIIRAGLEQQDAAIAVLA